MLVNYSQQGFTHPLTTEACNDFMQTCVRELLGTEDSSKAVAAVQDLVAHMQSSGQPAADLDTYAAAAQCHMQAIQTSDPQAVIIEMHTGLLPNMHQVLGHASDTCAVYATAMRGFEQAGCTVEVIQLLLLMIQNQVSSLNKECSLLIMNALMQEASGSIWDWVQDRFGEQFLENMTSSTDATEDCYVRIPAKGAMPKLIASKHKVPKLVLADEPMPVWMEQTTWSGSRTGYHKKDEAAQ